MLAKSVIKTTVEDVLMDLASDNISDAEARDIADEVACRLQQETGEVFEDEESEEDPGDILDEAF